MFLLRSCRRMSRRKKAPSRGACVVGLGGLSWRMVPGWTVQALQALLTYLEGLFRQANLRHLPAGVSASSAATDTGVMSNFFSADASNDCGGVAAHFFSTDACWRASYSPLIFAYSAS